MLPEALVIFACIKSAGCNETSSHYYATHPQVKEFVQRQEQRVEKYIGPTIIQTFGPILYVAAGGTGTVRLDKSFSLQFSREKGTLMYSWEW